MAKWARLGRSSGVPNWRNVEFWGICGISAVAPPAARLPCASYLCGPAGGPAVAFRMFRILLLFRFDDLMAYKQKVDQGRLKALEELAAEAQKHGMGY